MPNSSQGLPTSRSVRATQARAPPDEKKIGMRPGGRREIVVPAELAFGPEGDEASGVPAGVDLILVVDLIAVVTG